MTTHEFKNKEVNTLQSWNSVAGLINNVRVQKSGVEEHVKSLKDNINVREPNNFAAWLLKAVSVIDLTTLAGDDTEANVQRLCLKAAHPLSKQVYLDLGFDDYDQDKAPVTTAAVCVYPSKVPDAVKILHAVGLYGNIQVASVATGFPSGLYSLDTRVKEIVDAVQWGATEIDVVIDRSLVLTGQWEKLYEELKTMKKACGEAHLKVILGVGELATYTNVYKASMVAMAAGADFIKTSTGKEAVNATLPVGLVMCRAIRKFYNFTGRKVGLKPAGGIKTANDAVDWLILVKEELGDAWLSPRLFRIGASSLLGSLERCLFESTSGQVAEASRFTFM